MEKSRAQFEEEFRKEFDADMAKYGEKLVDFVKKEQFKIWQASRECLEVKLPEGFCVREVWCYPAYLVENELINIGVKIK